jgi:lipopolysaccharide/colanic/teichoic acid biosynthesis glycosyltransferase
MYKKYIKRLLDILLSFLALLILLPIIAVVALLVRVKLGSPVIYKARRPGRNEKIFTLCKFRSMTNAKDVNGVLLPDSQRLTKFGKFLRSTSLDELPELWNILKGDMSIIGPRPLAEQYLPYYNQNERRRHSVRPGLSGLAQVNGRNALGWEEKFTFDLEYVENLTFIQDVAILFKTVRKVFEKSDIGVRGVDSPIDFDVYRKMQNTMKTNERGIK